MKLLHKLKAYSLRRALIRQRAQNISDLRSGRRSAALIRREMIRHSRLANPAKPAPAPEDTAPRYPTGGGKTTGRMQAVLQSLPQLHRRAA